MERSGVLGSRRHEDVFPRIIQDGGKTIVQFTRGDRPRKAAAIEKTLPCTLEDLYNGTTKKMTISKDVVGASGRKSRVDEDLTIEIKPGWKKGTKITLPEKGPDVERGVIPADIIFTIDEKPHDFFKRHGDDLTVTLNISLAEALTGHTVQLATLDGRNLRVSMDSIISITHEEVVKGEGMPIQKGRGEKGNLILKFNIEIPKLTSEQKAGIRQLLTSSAELVKDNGKYSWIGKIDSVCRSFSQSFSLQPNTSFLGFPSSRTKLVFGCIVLCCCVILCTSRLLSTN